MARKKVKITKIQKQIKNIYNFLNKAYYDPKSPVSYFGPAKLYRYAKERNIKGITRLFNQNVEWHADLDLEKFQIQILRYIRIGIKE